MIKNIILLAVIFVLVDAGFLYLMKNNFYTMIKKIQGSPLKMKLIPTVACYIILVSSLYYFIVYKKGSYLDAFLLGFFIYGVYETTNMAIFKDWSPKVGLIDLTWGGFLFLITSYLYKNSIKYI
mgnify:FL=1|tara:strand:+ start:88 stop:459 length:372 start_codon:yes stop_codon:yes gene_type:complete